MISDVPMDENIVALFTDPKRKREFLEKQQLRSEKIVDDLAPHMKEEVIIPSSTKPSNNNKITTFCPIPGCDGTGHGRLEEENNDIVYLQFASEFERDLLGQRVKSEGKDLYASKSHIWFAHQDSPLVQRLLRKRQFREHHEDLVSSVFREIDKAEQAKLNAKRRLAMVRAVEAELPELVEIRKRVEYQQGKRLNVIEKKYLNNDE